MNISQEELTLIEKLNLWKQYVY